MQTYDILMVAVLVGTAAFGFMKGMAWQIASLASIVLSYFVSLKFNAQLAPVFGDSEPWNKYVAMLVIFIGCSFGIWLAFRAVSTTIDRVKLKEFDRQMGAIFGLVKGVVFCVAITYFAATLLPDDKKEVVLASKSGFYISKLLTKAEAIVPPEYVETVGPFLHKVNEGINEGHEHEGPGHEDHNHAEENALAPKSSLPIPNITPNMEATIDWSFKPEADK